jgi:hypothetical protein
MKKSRFTDTRAKLLKDAEGAELILEHKALKDIIKKSSKTITCQP